MCHNASVTASGDFWPMHLPEAPKLVPAQSGRSWMALLFWGLCTLFLSGTFHSPSFSCFSALNTGTDETAYPKAALPSGAVGGFLAPQVNIGHR